jgi:hypothetical protein
MASFASKVMTLSEIHSATMRAFDMKDHSLDVRIIDTFPKGTEFQFISLRPSSKSIIVVSKAIVIVAVSEKKSQTGPM